MHPSLAAERTRRTGLSQAEVVVSTVIVGVLMVSSFSTIAASRRSQVAESNEVSALSIADAMLAEIMQLPMREPSCDCGYGIDSGETGNRINLDDIDDYNGLVDTPPKSRSGVNLAGYSAFSRQVTVDRVQSANWNTTTTTYAGIYRITVRVLRGSTEVCRVIGYRTSGSAGSTVVPGFSAVN
jgi:MSHA pilin protein MshD